MKKTTTQFKKAITEFKKLGFTIDEYATEKRNIDEYKRELITKYNTFNLDLRHMGFNNCYTFEDCEKVIKAYFKDGKQKRTEELKNRFIDWDREFFDYNTVGYIDGLKLSFDKFKELVTEYTKKRNFYTIKYKLYSESWNRENKIKEVKQDFKQFVQLVLNCSDLKESDYIFKEYNEHVTFKLVNVALKVQYSKILIKDIMTRYKKNLCFNPSELDQVLDILNFKSSIVLCHNNNTKNDFVYLNLNSYQYNKIKQFVISKDNLKDYTCYGSVYISEINDKRFCSFNDMIKYLTSNNTNQKPQKELLKFLKGNYNKVV